MFNNLSAYALIQGLDRWIIDFIDFPTPKWITTGSSSIDPYLEKAEQIILSGAKIQFDSNSPIHLECIFNYLQVNQEKSRQKVKYYPFVPLSLKREDIFPNPEGGEDFKKLCEKFKEEFERLPGDENNPRIFSETLYYLLKKYTWCIPVSQQLPYIQLFEFLKIRAAIALGLYAHDLEEEKERFPFLLYCVDQSGIQSFLYNIASNKAVKSLKGRSFYLQLLMESIIQLITNHEEIPGGIVNLLYASGGKMYFILPNTLKVKNALQEIEGLLLKSLYNSHKMELYLAIGMVKFGWEKDVLIYEDADKTLKLGKSIGDLWRVLSEQTRKKTFQSYKSLLSANFNSFFNPNVADGFEESSEEKKVCAVTGETVNLKGENETEKRKRNDMLWHPMNKEEEERVWVTENVKKQVDLGYRLQQINYYKTFYPEKKYSKAHKDRLFNPLGLDVFHGMAGENEIKDEYNKNAEYKVLDALPSFNFAIVKKINDPTYFLPSEKQNLTKGYQSAYGFVFYGGDRQAFNAKVLKKEKNIRKAVKDFSQLIGLKSDEDKHFGFHRLGVLRMDVDGLGKIFREGMKEMQTFPAYATLSSQLDLFFSGYLNTIRESSKDFKNYLNIIYSGGDDIFAVGRWDLAILFAERIRKAFSAFVNDREVISISGGIALVGAKFPIAKAAELAGEAEDRAKDFKKNPKQKESDKNAFCLFDHPFSWEEEFDQVKKLKINLFKFYNLGLISSGFIQRMMAFQTIKDLHLKDITKNKSPDFSFLWNSAYFISRFQGRFKKLPKTADINLFLDEIKKGFFTGLKDEGRFFDIVAIAARWAEFEIRSAEND